MQRLKDTKKVREVYDSPSDDNRSSVSSTKTFSNHQTSLSSITPVPTATCFQHHQWPHFLQLLHRAIFVCHEVQLQGSRSIFWSKYQRWMPTPRLISLYDSQTRWISTMIHISLHQELLLVLCYEINTLNFFVTTRYEGFVKQHLAFWSINHLRLPHVINFFTANKPFAANIVLY